MSCRAERIVGSWLLFGTAFLATASIATADPAGEVDAELKQIIREASPDKPIQAILFLSDQVDLEELTTALDQASVTRGVRHQVVVESLMDKAASTQPGLLADLTVLRSAGRVRDFKPMWIANAIAVEASGAELERLAARPDVRIVYLDYPIEGTRPFNDPPPGARSGGSRSGRDGIGEHGNDEGGVENGIVVILAEENLNVIHVPDVWTLGFTGAGMLVSSLDTGVDGTHEALAPSWRGNDPAYLGHPEWAWFQTPATHNHGSVPQDFDCQLNCFGHGTHTMGLMCGNRPTGRQIGVAPDAQWINAAVIHGVHPLSDAMDALQWTADPDGNPATDFDVPCVSNNSWGTAGPECAQTLWSFIDAAEAAGVAVVWAAGNTGTSFIGRPATRATDELNSFSVGAFTHHDAPIFSVPTASSGGIAFCTPDGSGAVKPEISAPGVQVLSSVRGGGYEAHGGTSMASPHVAGVLALMFQANPNLTVPQAKKILIDTAVDNGACGNDIRYGWGMIDALAAVQAALNAIPPGLIVVPTDQPTLQQAIAAAASGDEIRVLDGVYTGASNRRLTVNKSVTIRSANGAANCIIDCQDLDLGFLITGAGTEVVLEGLTIRHGFADTASGGLSNSGGGVRVENCAAVTLRRCTIEDCRAFFDGAGVAFDNGDSLRIENCKIQRDTIPFVNPGHGRGGGIFLSTDTSTSEVRVMNSLITDNASDREGGGVAVVHAGGTPLTSVTLRNCTIANNQVTGGVAGVLGGGVFVQETSPPGNPAWAVKNCILWGNLVNDSPPSAFGDQLAFASLGSTLVSYSDVQGGSLNVANLNTGQWGTGNLEVNPNFVNPVTNFHLLKSSPCINAGDPNYPLFPGETDIDGGARIQNSRVDMGSDEKLLTILQGP